MIKKWEYMIVEDPDEEKLNKLGDEGWELICIIADSYYNELLYSGGDSKGTFTLRVYLKREKEE